MNYYRKIERARIKCDVEKRKSKEAHQYYQLKNK